jgi:hypothetical protein
MDELIKKTIFYNFKKLPNENIKIKPYCLSVETLSRMCWLRKSEVQETLRLMKTTRWVDFTFPAGLAYLTAEGIKEMNNLKPEDFQRVDAERLKRSVDHTAQKEKYALSHGIDPKTIKYEYDEKFLGDEA